ncbi:MAG: 7-cyano-7-deazaguanine synthase [Sedimentisphaerales bacterium]
MSIVTLVSGGIDSSLMALFAKKEGIIQHPLFIDYGQLGREKELSACRAIHMAHGLPEPKVINLSGFGETISSGITDRKKDIFAYAFLPGRNLLFLLAGGAYAYQTNANAVAIGLLNEETHLFPDQTSQFLFQAEAIISLCMGREIRIIAPLLNFYKADVLQFAKNLGLIGAYSCHSGLDEPCGICVSCKELLSAERKEE